MCMCMLTKRAQILFDEKVWDRLSKDAKSKNISVGEIVRQAIESTLKHRPKPFKGKIDYKALINEGRKAY